MLATRVTAGFCALLATVLLLACGGDEGDLELTWAYEPGHELTVGQDGSSGSLPTTIYVSNDTGSTVRNLELRFNPTIQSGVPAGMSVGTATNIGSRFDGPEQVWSLGDIEDGQTLVVALTLWLDGRYSLAETPQIELKLDLRSEEQDAVLASSRLSIAVNTE